MISSARHTELYSVCHIFEQMTGQVPKDYAKYDKLRTNNVNKIHIFHIEKIMFFCYR